MRVIGRWERRERSSWGGFVLWSVTARESSPRSAAVGEPAPAAEAVGVQELAAAGVEDADVDGVAGAHAERRGHGLGVAVGELQARGARRHRDAEVEVGAATDLLSRDVPLKPDLLLHAPSQPTGGP